MDAMHGNNGFQNKSEEKGEAVAPWALPLNLLMRIISMAKANQRGGERWVGGTSESIVVILCERFLSIITVCIEIFKYPSYQLLMQFFIYIYQGTLPFTL